MDERIVDRSTYATRKTTLGQEADEVWTDALEPAERIAMVWQLTMQAWAFKGLDHEPRLRRDVVRIVRRRPGDIADVAELEGG